uniref:NPY-4 receptor 1 n=1 Tax=Platynereis dumerilii TaxID=6359 RepID=A0A0K0PUF7_PLADU|nr:NPY-4 receptor 1 [Platynereis dumerilii]
MELYSGLLLEDLLNGSQFGFNMEDLEKNFSQYKINSDDASEQYRRDMITYYVMGIGGMTVCSLGIIGNILSLIVLTRRTMKSSTYSYLSALSVCDMLFLCFTIVLLIKDVHKPKAGVYHWPLNEGIYPYLFPYIHPAAFTFQVTSIWLTLAFTVDRYIMICHPFAAEPHCTMSRARKVIVALYSTGMLFNIPKFFEYETVIIPLPNDRTQVGCDLTKFGRSHVFRELYHSWFYIAFVCGLPFIALAVLNAFLMQAVHLSRRKGKEINAAEKKRNDTTVMLISVVVVFFICQTPALVSRVIWAFEHNPEAFKKMHVYTLNEIGNFLIIMNSSINIVPYYFFGRRFRKQFWRLFCRCLLGYKKFEKLSRSFSITVMENRRNSNMSAQHTIFIDRSNSEADRFELHCLKGNHVLKPGGTPRKTSSESAVSCGVDYQPLPKVVEANGNCLQAGQTVVITRGVPDETTPVLDKNNHCEPEMV